MRCEVEGINEFNGGVVIISHDIHLIRSLIEVSLFVVSNNTITENSLGFESYYNDIITN